MILEKPMNICYGATNQTARGSSPFQRTKETALQHRISVSSAVSFFALCQFDYFLTTFRFRAYIEVFVQLIGNRHGILRFQVRIDVRRHLDRAVAKQLLGSAKIYTGAIQSSCVCMAQHVGVNVERYDRLNVTAPKA